MKRTIILIVSLVALSAVLLFKGLNINHQTNQQDSVFVDTNVLLLQEEIKSPPLLPKVYFSKPASEYLTRSDLNAGPELYRKGYDYQRPVPLPQEKERQRDYFVIKRQIEKRGVNSSIIDVPAASFLSQDFYPGSRKLVPLPDGFTRQLVE